MTRALQNLEDRARDSHVALVRLVGVGVDAELDGLAHIAGARELGLQDFRGVGLVEKACLEVESRRKAQVRVGRTRKAEGASCGASSIRIDGLIESNIRRIVRRDDAARLVRLE